MNLDRIADQSAEPNPETTSDSVSLPEEFARGPDLSPERIARLQQVFDRSIPTPKTAAEAFLRRLVETGTVPASLNGKALARKSKNIAAAIALVIKNADMLGPVAGVMARGASAHSLVGGSRAFELAVRAELVATVRDMVRSSGIEWTSADEADWAVVMGVVADATFGPMVAERPETRAA